MDLNPIVLAVHLLAASAWLGAGWYHKLIVAPAVRDAGAEGLGVVAALTQRGGGGRWFGPASILTVASGGVLYWRLGVNASTRPGMMLIVGAGLGIVALLLGVLVHRPAEARLKGAVDEGDASGIHAHVERLGRHTDLSGYLVTAAFLLMTLRHVV